MVGMVVGEGEGEVFDVDCVWGGCPVKELTFQSCVLVGAGICSVLSEM